MFKFYRMNMFNVSIQNDSTVSPMSNKENDSFTVTVYQSVFYLCLTYYVLNGKQELIYKNPI